MDCMLLGMQRLRDGGDPRWIGGGTLVVKLVLVHGHLLRDMSEL